MRRIGQLKLETPGEREIVLTREFDAPRKLVFEAYTKPELIKRWLTGPPGWSLAVCEVDLRVGGKMRYVWRGEGGVEMGMTAVIREVVAPERLVSAERFDEAWYPGECIGTIALTEHGGTTTLTQTLRYDSREARDAVLRTPMEQGVAYGYDQLAALVVSLGGTPPRKP